MPLYIQILMDQSIKDHKLSINNVQDTELDSVGDTKCKIQFLPLRAHSVVIETWQVDGFAYKSIGNKYINEFSLWEQALKSKVAIYWLNATGYRINYKIRWLGTKCCEYRKGV